MPAFAGMTNYDTVSWREGTKGRRKIKARSSFSFFNEIDHNGFLKSPNQREEVQYVCYFFSSGVDPGPDDSGQRHSHP
jgi:hypothetical protein